MSVAIDMVGTNIQSATKNYNINFCNCLIDIPLKRKVYIFVTKEYFVNLKKNSNQNIIYIIKPPYFSKIILRFLWMQFFLPLELKKLNVDTLFSPMNFGPILLKFFNIKLVLGLHSNLPWVYFKKMPGNYLRKILTKYIMEKSIKYSKKLIVTSNFAKREIKKKLSLKKNIYSINLGIDNEFLKKKIIIK